MKPGDTPSLEEVLAPNPGPIVTTAVPLEQPVPIVIKDDLGLFGEANVIAAAIGSVAGRSRLPRWIRLSAYVIAAIVLTRIVLAFF